MMDRGTGSGAKMKCDICHLPLEGTMIGCGDGTGSRFAHPSCYYRRESEAKDATIAALKQENERLREELAEWEKHKNLMIDALHDKTAPYVVKAQEAEANLEYAKRELNAVRESFKRESVMLAEAQYQALTIATQRDNLKQYLATAEDRIESQDNLIEHQHQEILAAEARIKDMEESMRMLNDLYEEGLERERVLREKVKE